MTEPRSHRWIETEDGSQTLYSEAFQEACHSTSGARAETLLHYLQGCRVEEKIKTKESMTILEVGFGTGLGLTMTYEALSPFKKPVHFITLEIEQALVDWFFAQPQNAAYEFHLNFINGVSVLEGRRDLFTFTILIGNARKTLPAYLEKNPLKWNAIYQDAFSPKRNPVLWTVEWFELLRNFSSQDVTMSTYSASNSIRKSMELAGWKIAKGEKFGPKRTSTRARLEGSTDPEIREQLDRSPISPIRDQELSGELFT